VRTTRLDWLTVCDNSEHRPRPVSSGQWYALDEFRLWLGFVWKNRRSIWLLKLRRPHHLLAPYPRLLSARRRRHSDQLDPNRLLLLLTRRLHFSNFITSSASCHRSGPRCATTTPCAPSSLHRRPLSPSFSPAAFPFGSNSPYLTSPHFTSLHFQFLLFFTFLHVFSSLLSGAPVHPPLRLFASSSHPKSPSSRNHPPVPTYLPTPTTHEGPPALTPHIHTYICTSWLPCSPAAVEKAHRYYRPRASLLSSYRSPCLEAHGGGNLQPK